MNALLGSGSDVMISSQCGRMFWTLSWSSVFLDLSWSNVHGRGGFLVGTYCNSRVVVTSSSSQSLLIPLSPQCGLSGIAQYKSVASPGSGLRMGGGEYGVSSGARELCRELYVRSRGLTVRG